MEKTFREEVREALEQTSEQGKQIGRKDMLIEIMEWVNNNKDLIEYDFIKELTKFLSSLK